MGYVTSISRVEEMLSRTDIDGRWVGMDVRGEEIQFHASDDLGHTEAWVVVAAHVLERLSDEALINFLFDELATALQESVNMGGRTVYIAQ
jgi:hypothetical protein